VGRHVQETEILGDTGSLTTKSPMVRRFRPSASSKLSCGLRRRNRLLHPSRPGRPNETSHYAMPHRWHLLCHSRMPLLCQPQSGRRVHPPSPAEHHGLHHQQHENQILVEVFPLNLSCLFYSSANQVILPYQTTR